MILSSPSSASRAHSPTTPIRARAVRIAGPDFLRRSQGEILPPLRVIQNLPNWIEDQVASGQTDPDAIAPNLRAIIRQACRVERFLADMTAFEALRYHPCVPHRFSPRDRLEALVHRLFPEGPCVIELHGKSGPLSCDADLFDLMLTELITNAVIHNDNPAGYTAVLLDENEGVLRISVTDDGPGIAVEDRARIFEPFEKLASDEPIDTSGLGLAKVVRAAGLAHADLEIGTAGPAGGTCVTITFRNTPEA